MAKTKPTPSPAPEAPRENRYLRSARILVLEGCGLPIAELAVRANMSVATANHCVEAYKGVCTALREAKLLPAKDPGQGTRSARGEAGSPAGAGSGEIGLTNQTAERGGPTATLFCAACLRAYDMSLYP